MFKKFGYVATAALMFGSSAVVAFADTIDEQQKEFLSQLAVAKNTKQITSKQASELDGDMREVSKMKRQLRDAHGDVVTADDEAKLNKMINDVAQKLETMTANKVPMEKNKAPLEKKIALLAPYPILIRITSAGFYFKKPAFLLFAAALQSECQSGV